MKRQWFSKSDCSAERQGGILILCRCQLIKHQKRFSENSNNSGQKVAHPKRSALLIRTETQLVQHHVHRQRRWTKYNNLPRRALSSALCSVVCEPVLRRSCLLNFLQSTRVALSRYLTYLASGHKAEVNLQVEESS